MGSPWLAMGPYSVRMKRTTFRKRFKYLPGPFSAPKQQLQEQKYPSKEA